MEEGSCTLECIGFGRYSLRCLQGVTCWLEQLAGHGAVTRSAAQFAPDVPGSIDHCFALSNFSEAEEEAVKAFRSGRPALAVEAGIVTFDAA